ncbi:MAG: hypothetical protein HKN76_00815 [Saprospiraceae bacterium]|nr:hypothetical protein [Saprospiraceae bacterium]
MKNLIDITKRELEVLDLISREFTSDEIAKKLYISNHTAITHRKNLIIKMGVRNTAGLVRKAFEYQLLSMSVWIVLLMFIGGFSLSAQIPHLDVEGHVKIRGNVDIHHPEDSTSLFIGFRSGVQSDLTESRLNTFIGFESGQSNTTGAGNSFFGSSSGADNTTGEYNSFFGEAAGQRNTTGRKNSFFGKNTGQVNTTGGDNSFVGYNVGRSTTTGGNNTFIGSEAGLHNTVGNHNSFLGYVSGYQNRSGWGNCFFGYASGENNETGTQNVFLGYRTGQTLISGSYNTFIGTEADLDNTVSNDSLDRAIAIGFNAKVACHNCAVIGGTGQDSVYVGIGTTTPKALLHVEGTNGPELLLRDTEGLMSIRMDREPISGQNGDQSWKMIARIQADTSFILQYGSDSLFRLKRNGDVNIAGTLSENSDFRLKTEISKLSEILPRLLQIHGYTYNWKDPGRSGQRQLGLIAQEVQDTFPELVQKDEHGLLSVNYTRFVPLLIEGLREQQEAILEQNAVLQNQQENVDHLSKENKLLRQRLDRIEQLYHKMEATLR